MSSVSLPTFLSTGFDENSQAEYEAWCDEVDALRGCGPEEQPTEELPMYPGFAKLDDYTLAEIIRDPRPNQYDDRERMVSEARAELARRLPVAV